jgi:sideroflexin-1/3
MVLTPMLVNFLEKKTTILKRFRWANSPIQVLFCGVCLTFATPLCCALFSQKASISVDSLEIEIRDKVKKLNPNCTTLSYNKGL